MKKYIYIGIISLIIIATSVTIIILKPDSKPEVEPLSIEIVEESIPKKDYHVLISQIKVRVLYSDTTFKIIDLDEEMLSRKDLEKLSTIGKHIIVVSYLGLITDFEIEIIPKPVFEVIFYDNFDRVLSQQMVELGNDAIAPINTNVDGYTFIGWDIELTNVQSNLIVKGIYEKIPVYYNVKFKCDITGEVLKYESVLEGNDATPPQPKELKGYKFSHWYGNYTNVNRDSTVLAIYEELHRVTFADKNGKAIKVEYVENNGKATPPDGPTYVPDGYFFAGWDGDYNCITSRTLFYPVFREISEKYYIRVIIDNYRPALKEIFQTDYRIELTIYTSQPIDIDYIIYPTTTPQNVSWEIRDNNNNASIDENGIFISNIEGTYRVGLTYSDGETEVSEYITIYVRN